MKLIEERPVTLTTPDCSILSTKFQELNQDFYAVLRFKLLCAIAIIALTETP